MADSAVRVALAGNPNSGKTSIFNALTGARQHVGNYAGVTVEKREGHFRLDGRRFDVLDLPGTYSLSSYSPEERIAQDELLSGVQHLLGGAFAHPCATVQYTVHGGHADACGLCDIFHCDAGFAHENFLSQERSALVIEMIENIKIGC